MQEFDHGRPFRFMSVHFSANLSWNASLLLHYDWVLVCEFRVNFSIDLSWNNKVLVSACKSSIMEGVLGLYQFISQLVFPETRVFLYIMIDFLRVNARVRSWKALEVFFSSFLHSSCLKLVFHYITIRSFSAWIWEFDIAVCLAHFTLCRFTSLLRHSFHKLALHFNTNIKLLYVNPGVQYSRVFGSLHFTSLP